MLVIRYHDRMGKHLGDLEKGNFQISESVEAITNPYKSPIFAQSATRAFIFDHEDGETIVDAFKDKAGRWKVIKKDKAYFS